MNSIDSFESSLVCVRCGVVSSRVLAAREPCWRLKGHSQDEEQQLGQEVFDELKAEGRNRRILSSVRHIEADCGRHHASGAAPIQPPVQVLPGP